MSIDPPLPAVSRPSKMMTTRMPFSPTQRDKDTSSLPSGFNNASYSGRLSLLSPLIPEAPFALHCGTGFGRLEHSAGTARRAEDEAARRFVAAGPDRRPQDDEAQLVRAPAARLRRARARADPG